MRFYRLLLLLFPASFRAKYGEEMCAVFASRRRAENAIGLWTGTIFDVVANAFGAHLDLLRQDLQWTFRILRQAPGFTMTALAVTALGIGANTAAFTLLDHVLLRPLPFPRPEQLVMIYQTQAANGYSRVETSPATLRDWREGSRSFASMGGYYSGLSVNLSGQGEPVQLNKVEITSDVLKTLEVQPARGRGFNAADEREGAADAVLLSDGLATTLFGGADAALGRKVRLDNQPYEVVGVMPGGFAFPSREVQLWTPLRFPASVFTDPEDRANLYVNTVARLRNGVSVDRALAEVGFISKRIERAFPKQNAGVGANVFPLRDTVTPQSRMLVMAVFGAALCVLLIACTNLANLLLARAMVRKREMAVRIAIGAGRERLLRQLFTENLALAVAGGALGLLLAMVATPSLARLVPDALPVSGVPRMDPRVFAFAAVLTLGTSLAFGIGPALRASGKVDLTALRMKAGGGGRSDRLRGALVLAEVAVTMMLLVSTGLLLKALWRIQAVDPGFRTENVLTLETTLPLPRYEAVAPRLQFYNRVLTGARALPGVEAAGYISFLPLTKRGGIWPVMKPGQDENGASTPRALLRFVTPGFFDAMGIPVKGRDVSDRDTGSTPFVAVVSEAFARRSWPGQDALERQIKVAFFERTVVGVVRDISVRGLERSSEPQIYLPAPQVPDGGLRPYAPKDLVVRVSGKAGSAAGLAPALRRIVHEADPDQAVSEVRMLNDLVASQTGSRQAQLRVLGAFAGIALLLAAVGIHGLLSFAVSARVQEVGVRVALGALPRDILGMFLGQGLTLGLAGVLVATPLAYAAGRAMGTLMFGVEPGDFVVYAAAASIALGMVLAGSLRPAVRAARVDPATTIRME
jgi:predicted permease